MRVSRLPLSAALSTQKRASEAAATSPQHTTLHHAKPEVLILTVTFRRCQHPGLRNRLCHPGKALMVTPSSQLVKTTSGATTRSSRQVLLTITNVLA